MTWAAVLSKVMVLIVEVLRLFHLVMQYFVPYSFALILMWKRELLALICLPS